MICCFIRTYTQIHTLTVVRGGEELEIRLKAREMVVFVLDTEISTLHDVKEKDLLLLLKEVEKRVFSLKNGLTTCYLLRHISTHSK